jgi:hypothetical protein
MRRRATVAALGAVLVLAITGAGSGSGLAQSGETRCDRDDARTLLDNGTVRVSRVPTDPDSTARDFRVVACHRATDYEESVDTGSTSFAYLPPALSLDGAVLGFALLACDDDGCSTRVWAHDLARVGAPAGSSIGAPASLARGQRTAKVGSLRVKSNGSMAWIACPESGDPFAADVPASRRPNCVRPGSLDRVYALEAPSAKPRLLDKGRDIDPSSLRRKGSVFSWVADGRRRRATLD